MIYYLRRYMMPRPRCKPFFATQREQHQHQQHNDNFGFMNRSRRGSTPVVCGEPRGVRAFRDMLFPYLVGVSASPCICTSSIQHHFLLHAPNEPLTDAVIAEAYCV